MRKFFFIYFFFLLTVISSANDNKNFLNRQIKFINELYINGRYFDCIAETEKIQITENSPDIEYFIFSNYYLAGQYATVINNYNINISSDEMHFKSLLLLSGSFLKKEKYFESYETLKKFEYNELPSEYIFTMFLRRTESLILTGDNSMIDNEISKSGAFLEDNYNFKKLREELLLYKKNELKNPSYSALISAFLPGLGQCYNGYPMDGLISFTAIAATLAGGLYLRDSGKKDFSYTLFFFSGLFYGGNIYGAYNSAQAENNKELHRRRNSIISQYGSYNPGDYVDIESIFH